MNRNQQTLNVPYSTCVRSDRLIPAHLDQRRLFLGILALLVASYTSGCGARPSQPSKPDASVSGDPKTDLQAAIAARDWSSALAVSQQAMIACPKDADVLTNAAIAAAQTGDPVKGAKLLLEAVQVTDFALDGGRIDFAVQALLDVGQIHQAIALLDEVVRRHPDAASHRRMLVGFLGEAQLTEQVDQHLAALIEQRQFDLPLLLATTETSARRFSSNSIELLLARNPDDTRPRLGEAKQLLDQRDAGRAESVLASVIQRHPDFAAAHAMLGVALATQGQRESYPTWYQSLPADASEHSGYWFALGDWALSSGNPAGAIRALAEATRRAPNELAYWSSLAVAIRKWRETFPDSDALDDEQVLNGILRRQNDLLALRDQFAAFKSDGQSSQTGALQIAKTLHRLGRLWESEAWLAIATTLRDQPSSELQPYRERLLQELAVDRDWQSRRDHPEVAFDLTPFELPSELQQLQETDGTRYRLRMADAKPIQMREASESLGMSFYGRVGDAVLGPRIPITQTLGCGGAVLDYDMDGRQDLVFAAAGGAIGQRDSDPGAIFRNIGTMSDVSRETNFGDPGYSQGIVSGDYNDDGLPDLLVLNLGPNRLFRNNGDGTYSDVSDVLGNQGAGAWSTSGAILDVNSDGHNDIVIANYCDLRDPLEAPCFDADGNPINCYPLEYRAAQDQILSGQADGTFVDTTSGWIAEATLGRGLGIIAGRLDGRTQCIYIVNDASPNTFYHWQAENNRLVDQGIASGLAVDRQSLDQGSMGIASSDFDLDGDLDFYVTGFANEYNILYEQQSPGYWLDNSAAKGMVEPTLRMVGFGSHAIDIDHDGIDEIVVANGHVGVFAPPLPAYEQPVQVFRQTDDGRYESVDLKSWGDYFATPHVGRALMTGDINADGWCDVVITHATEPVAVLLNDAQNSNHRAAFRLVDRDGNRDAMGAVVEFELGDPSAPLKRRLFQLAGDGYLCTNQQALWVGTGSETIMRNVRVVWPDGNIQSMGDLATDAIYLLVRGDTPYPVQFFDQDATR